MSKTPSFNVGDIVKLKSGGPDMTVKEVRTNRDDEFNGNYRCQWFAGKKLDLGDFPEESLLKVEVTS
ncbi:DUF2158 domain-containing protein [Vibrio parahaemolyticus]|uniref:YodC family protein n=1 Tax=Vibrio harveyi group TaxID=717610 RepID=UPI0002C48343|nr:MULTISPECIES: DUF2158 domain-containing protein [Vibrio harveyi group]EHZ2751565.1 DUF2158 domain-containing protein [Vibrio parahaemolyticus]EIZ1284378.1 DUF2158 domain-containing protein [Vibrio vulnificus]EKE1120949.1 DUF2158 domain-containing protein [Vibrio vulnificus]ELA9894848.1 DUF2158 domain-containing protein [Vibrio parahaemolyticus]EME0140562.1 DUF2158 domain-containing protein [Vibrio vulnificus]